MAKSRSSNADVPLERVRCPIHGFIHYTKRERKIIDHPLFSRLRYIRQLALEEFVYPGATHTRFAHSLGVMEVATRLFDSLVVKSGPQMKTAFREVSNLGKPPLIRARQLLRLAGLLHDVGHASFSHVAEGIVNCGRKHEDLTKEIVEGEAFLGGLIDESFGIGASLLVSQIIGGDGLPPQLSILHDLISGEIDADRTDYLVRDSYHCGVAYGQFDFLRLIESVELRKDELGGLTLALDKRDVHLFEALVIARYQMNMQVYYHRIRRIYDYYLKKYFESLGGAEFDTAEKVLAQNDITMMARIFEDASRNDGEKGMWARRILFRRHHKLRKRTQPGAGVVQVKEFRQEFLQLKRRYPETDFVFDFGEGKIHKVLTPGDKQDDGLLDFKLKDGRKWISLGQESDILGKIPSRFLFAMIFEEEVDPVSS